MWSLVKGIFALVVLGVVAYVVFLVPLGGATLATHASDVWRSPVVQEKVGLMKDGVEQELQQRVSDARQAGTPPSARPIEEISEADRAALERLLTPR